MLRKINSERADLSTRRDADILGEKEWRPAQKKPTVEMDI
jgi:hypothetical protein